MLHSYESTYLTAKIFRSEAYNTLTERGRRDGAGNPYGERRIGIRGDKANNYI
jgi:hypothetical protein